LADALNRRDGAAYDVSDEEEDDENEKREGEEADPVALYGLAVLSLWSHLGGLKTHFIPGEIPTLWLFVLVNLTLWRLELGYWPQTQMTSSSRIHFASAGLVGPLLEITLVPESPAGCFPAPNACKRRRLLSEAAAPVLVDLMAEERESRGSFKQVSRERRIGPKEKFALASFWPRTPRRGAGRPWKRGSEGSDPA